MQQLGQFIITHWALWIAFIVLLILTFVNEIFSQKNRAKEISAHEAVAKINHEDAIVIDLREATAFREGHIIDAINASNDDFNSKRMDKYKTKPMILVCARGLQSGTLGTKLRTQGFDKLLVLRGGMTAWQSAGLPLVKGKG